MDKSQDQTLTYVRHCDLDLPLTVRVSSLQGRITQRPLPDLLSDPALKHAGSQQALPSDLYVLIELWSGNNKLVPSVRTAHKSFKDKHKYAWNEVIQFGGIKFRDLPRDAQLTVTVYDIADPKSKGPVGGSTMTLFGKKATLRKGKQRLLLHKGLQADGRVATDTPSKIGAMKDEMGRLEKLVKKHERGDLRRLDWLDKLAFRHIEKIHQSESEKSDQLFLYVDMPRFDFPIVFSEPVSRRTERALAIVSRELTRSGPRQEYVSAGPSTSVGTAVPPAPQTTIAPSLTQPTDPPLFAVIDPETTRNNPVEAKHRRLVRDHRSGPLDRELKPNAKIRDELNEILRYSPTRSLNTRQKDLLWQFRFYLTRDKRALTKFCKAVVWSDPGEASQAVDVLLPMWASIEMDDAIELLGPGEGFRRAEIRTHAVKRLAKADDEELILYLLQLVQALKFGVEAVTSPSSSMRMSKHRLAQSSILASRHLPAPPTGPDLEEFLVDRAARNPVLGNQFFWYILVEAEDKTHSKMYRDILARFERRMDEVQEPGDTSQRDVLKKQAEFIATLSKLAVDIRTSKDARPKKIERLRNVLRDSKHSLSSFGPMPLALDASKTIVGIDADLSSVFKSNLFPLRLQFVCDDGSSYPVIFKNGDDLRQDQLVIQLFTLMDRLMRKENLDLKLTPYRVLATGALDGMVQLIESRSLQDLANEYGGQLLAYFKAHHPDPGSVGTLGIKADVLDTYIRSCAGYCVVTYLLGVGDRHLDNLLLSPDGHFFHVDFGYILGRDPKPFPPAVKVCKEMVDAMGGVQSPHYARFKSLCHTAFSSLRKNANLILNLVALMVDGNIPDIKLEPDKAVSKVQDKFMLNKSEEEAIKEFEALLNETSYFTSVLDRIHSVAQYWRS